MSSTNLPSRRTRVKPGVYFRVGADGKRRYEIDYLDHEGRRRWKVIDGGLREAEAAREQLREKKRKGEQDRPVSGDLRRGLGAVAGRAVGLASRHSHLVRGSLAPPRPAPVAEARTDQAVRASRGSRRRVDQRHAGGGLLAVHDPGGVGAVVADAVVRGAAGDGRRERGEAPGARGAASGRAGGDAGAQLRGDRGVARGGG